MNSEPLRLRAICSWLLCAFPGGGAEPADPWPDDPAGLAGAGPDGGLGCDPAAGTDPILVGLPDVAAAPPPLGVAWPTGLTLRLAMC
jgi:hypothetical protein